MSHHTRGHQHRDLVADPLVIPRPAGGTWADLDAHERATVAAFACYGGPVARRGSDHAEPDDDHYLNVRLGIGRQVVKNDLTSAARRLGLGWQGWMQLIVWAWGCPGATPGGDDHAGRP